MGLYVNNHGSSHLQACLRELKLSRKPAKLLGSVRGSSTGPWARNALILLALGSPVGPKINAFKGALREVPREAF